MRSSFFHCSRIVGRRVLHAVVEARERDAAVLVVQSAENMRQHADRIAGGTAEQAGMQVAVGGLDPHLLIDEPAQRRGDRRRVLVPHAGVADEREVGGEIVLVALQERGEILRADLLLALDQQRDRHRKAAGDLLPGAAASTKVISWPLSSSAPRATIALRPSGKVRTAGSNGGFSQRFNGSTGCTS